MNERLCGETGLELAEQVVVCARTAAAERGLSVAVAVVDRGGHLVAAARMDGVPYGGMTTAIDKAFSAAAWDAPTSLWRELVADGSLATMTGLLGGRQVLVAGGVPLRRDGRPIGAIGVSGAAPDDDHWCATEAARVVGAG